MTLRVVGAGWGRTGTSSLRLALETLLGAPCYHMTEVRTHPEHVPIWHNAGLGKMPNWNTFFADYTATVDNPAAWFWPELIEAFPDALVLLSVRDPEAWWNSVSQTIYRDGTSSRYSDEHMAMIKAVRAIRGISNHQDRDVAIGEFEAHNAQVRETVPSDRLLVWQPGDGWGPICKALDLPIPDEPFPHTNTKEEWLSRNLPA